MPIRVLDTHTAELIAAGEVVERPASVVKELMENSIDAGARHMEVEIEQGGVRLIRVQDDGGGILAQEVPLAFLRHATSKVKNENDLDAIATLGFRGEALASIASVSRVELLTHAKEDDDACLYKIEGGVEIELSEAARPLGTTFSVRDLFYNTPARMKFLKKDASEAAFVTELVGRLALSHPEVAVRYLRDGKEVFHTPGEDNLTSAAYAVLGKEFAKGLFFTEYQKPPYSVQGLVTWPNMCRKSRSMQFFFINGRFVKSRTMMAALEQAYRKKTMHGRFPGCILFLTMPPELVDVNVHPAKTEVRFASETEVFSAVYAAVKEALEQEDDRHATMKLAQSASLPNASPVETVVPPENSIAEEKPKDGFEHLPIQEMVQTLASSEEVVPYRIIKQKQKPGFLSPDATEFGLDIRRHEQEIPAVESCVPQQMEAEIPLGSKNVERDAQTASLDALIPVRVDGITEKIANESELEETLLYAANDADKNLCYIGELFSTYILAQCNETLYVIDKHAAHERILYEKFAGERKCVDAQMLLCPVAVSLGGAEKAALLDNEDILRESGIEFEEFGGGDLLVRAVPADIRHEDIEGLLVDVAKGLVQGNQVVCDEKTEWVLHSMACRAAVKGGDNTPSSQLLHLAQQILNKVVPPFCPHGRPVVLEITRKELEKQFGRLG